MYQERRIQEIFWYDVYQERRIQEIFWYDVYQERRIQEILWYDVYSTRRIHEIRRYDRFLRDGNELYHFIMQIGDGGLQSGFVIAVNVREILKVCPGIMEILPGKQVLDLLMTSLGRKIY